MPLILFIGIGAMIDFEPLLLNPKLMLFGAAAQFGIFFTLCFATLLGFPLKDAASIGIIGAADGPTSIFVANTLRSEYMAAIMVAAYSYMALVPIVQPPIIRLCTTKKERLIESEINANNVETATRCELWLETIRKELDKANNMFDLNLSVDWRVNPQTEIDDGWTPEGGVK